MKLLITGATGAAGSEILRQALANPSVASITVLSRRELEPHVQPTLAPKASVVIHKDFTSYPSSLDLGSYDACIWALGKSSAGMSEKDYTFLTHDMPMSAIEAFKNAGAGSAERPFRFVHVSGEGADPSGKARLLFARVKGRAEADLLDFASTANGSMIVHNIRPGYFFPADPQDRKIIRGGVASFADSYLLGPVFKTVVPSSYIPVSDLGKFAVGAALGQFGGHGLFRNRQMRELLAGVNTSS